jgi:hypothetical protein
MTPEYRKSAAENMSTARQQLGKHVPAAMDMQAKVEVFLE